MASGEDLNAAARIERGEPARPPLDKELEEFEVVLDEGFRQLALGLYWVQLHHTLSKLESPEARKLAETLLCEVLEPWLSVSWVPFVTPLIEEYRKQPSKYAGCSWKSYLEDGRARIRQRITLLEGEIPSAEDLERFVREAHVKTKASSSQDIPHLSSGPKREPFRISSSMQSTNWIIQACVYNAWNSLNKEVADLEDQSTLGPVLDDALYTLDLARAELCQMPHHAQKVKDAIGRVQKVKTKLESISKERLGNLHPNLRRNCNDVIERTHKTWPPRVLAHLSNRLGYMLDAGYEGKRLLELILAGLCDGSEADARLYLVIRLLFTLDEIDQVDRLPVAAWNIVERHVQYLLPSNAAYLVRGENLEPAEEGKTWVKRRSQTSNAPRTTLETGLAIRGENGGPCKVLRQAVVGVPLAEFSPLYPLLAALVQRNKLDGMSEQIEALQRLIKTDPKLESLDAIGRRAIWDVLIRSLTQPPTEVAALVDVLRRLGYELVPTSREPVDEEDPGWVCLLPSSRTRRAQPLLDSEDDAIALRAPDGREYFPRIWYQVPVAWMTANDFPGVIERHRNTHWKLVSITRKEGARPRVSYLIEEYLAGRTPPGTTGENPALTLFRELLSEAERSGSEPDLTERHRLAGPLRAFATDLYAALDAHAKATLGVPLKPNLTPDLERLRREDGGQVEIEWAERSPSSELVARVCAFAHDGRPARLLINPGEEVAPRVRAWAGLPQPGSLAGGLLAEAHRELRWLPADKAPDPGPTLARLSARLKAAEAAEGLDAFVKTGLIPGEPGPARAWLQRMVGESVVQLYPDLDPATLRPKWPEQADPADLLGLDWDCARSIEPGGLLQDRPLLFAARPAGAIATFCFGPVGSHPWIDAAVDLRDTIDNAPEPIRSLLAGPARTVRLATAIIRRGADARPDDPVEVLRPALHALIEAASAAHAVRATCDRVLDRLREWGSPLGVRILPDRWSFAQPLGHETADPAQVEVETIEGAFVSSATEAGRLVLRSFGWTTEGGPTTRARAEVSAGPSPIHYEELLAALRAADCRALVERLESWPDAARKGQLEAYAVLFYIEFWKSLGDDFRRKRFEEFKPMEAMLCELLRESFGLHKFEPKQLYEFNEKWVQVRKQSQAKTGRIRRIWLPGLRTTNNELKVRAEVEVE